MGLPWASTPFLFSFFSPCWGGGGEDKMPIYFKVKKGGGGGGIKTEIHFKD